MALDIKGAFESIWWKGFLAHLWNIGFCDKAFRSHLSNRYIRVVTPLDSTDLCCLTTGVPQGAIWSPPLFNLYIYIYIFVNYLLFKTDCITAASDLNCDLAALYHFGQSWQIKFAPNKHLL